MNVYTGPSVYAFTCRFEEVVMTSLHTVDGLTNEAQYYQHYSTNVNIANYQVWRNLGTGLYHHAY